LGQTGIAAYDVAVTLADEHLKLGHSVIIDAVNPVEAPRVAWRNLAAKYRAGLRVIECVCTDQVVHRRRIEARLYAEALNYVGLASPRPYEPS
jgi:predicted kinase